MGSFVPSTVKGFLSFWRRTPIQKAAACFKFSTFVFKKLSEIPIFEYTFKNADFESFATFETTKLDEFFEKNNSSGKFWELPTVFQEHFNLPSDIREEVKAFEGLVNHRLLDSEGIEKNPLIFQLKTMYRKPVDKEYRNFDEINFVRQKYIHLLKNFYKAFLEKYFLNRVVEILSIIDLCEMRSEDIAALHKLLEFIVVHTDNEACGMDVEFWMRQAQTVLASRHEINTLLKLCHL